MEICFRIAVKEVEAWLLADIEGLSQFFRVSKVNFPKKPENEIDPKQTLIELAKRSRLRTIKDDIVPINEYAKIGPNYNARMTEFVNEYWNIESAINRSRSLEKAFSKLRTFR
jgi:hypothetical protein